MSDELDKDVAASLERTRALARQNRTATFRPLRKPAHGKWFMDQAKRAAQQKTAESGRECLPAGDRD